MQKIELQNENCFTYLPKLERNSIDLIIIDPPYEVSRDTNFTGLDEIIKECYRILKKSGTLICFYDLWKITTLQKYFLDAKFQQLRFIEWLKTNPVPLNSKTNYLTNAREIAICGVKIGKPTFNSAYDKGVYEYPICHTKDRFHPTQKPVELLEELIQKHSNPNDTILDCFAGSASTAIAAYKQNRNFIGCEISKEYYNKAMNRIQTQTKPPTF